MEDKKNTYVHDQETDQRGLIDSYELKLSALRLQVETINDQLIKLNDECQKVSSLYNEVVNSQYWKITKPLRIITNALKKALRKSKITYYPCKALKILLTRGLGGVVRSGKNFFHTNTSEDFSKISKQCRAIEENTVFERNIKFSILVPLYNTPIRYLKEMIKSVQAQTYKNWELCLADGSDSEHTNVEEFVKKLQLSDSRIVYKKLEKNLGISENTNECIKMSTGEYIGLFDHDDILHPSALFENMKAICEHNADFLYTDEATFEGNNIRKIVTFHFKPDFAPDNLRANNYICHFSVFSRELLEKTGMFRSEYDGSQDHDMILRLTSNANKVFHIRRLLYFWRSHPNSVAKNLSSKTYAVDAGIRAVKDNIKASGYDCEVESSWVLPTIYRIKYELKEQPLVSIIIPNMNHMQDLKRCISSIVSKSTYQNYEIIIVENNSYEESIFDYYEQLEKCNNIHVVNYHGVFNYSDINNFGAEYAKGKYFILLNNDTEVITPSWIEEMLMYAQRDDVGAVGTKLYYPDGTVQHAGVIVGLGGIAGHTHIKNDKMDPGYMGKMYFAQNLSAVTAACMMVSRDLFEELGGLDCGFAVAFNDVDLCMRIREKGLLIVMNPYAELYHYESKSRGSDVAPKNIERFKKEIELFENKWGDSILKNGDPYYNPNFSLLNDYEILYDKINEDKMK